MKRTNVYFFHSDSWSFKSLITGVFLLVLMGFANQGSAQSQPPTAESVLPALKSKTECVDLAKEQTEILKVQLQADPQNRDLRALWDAYTFVIMTAAEPTIDMPIVLAQLYGVMHTEHDGTTTHSYGFYSKNWSRSYAEIVQKFRKI